MDQPQQPTQLPLVDAGNPMLEPGNSFLVCGIAPNRNVAIVTVREGNTTLTVFLNKESIGRWITDLTTTRGQMTDLIVPNGVMDLSKIAEAMKQNGIQPK